MAVAVGTSTRQKPPGCSLLSANGPSVTSPLPLRTRTLVVVAPGCSGAGGQIMSFSVVAQSDGLLHCLPEFGFARFAPSSISRGSLQRLVEWLPPESTSQQKNSSRTNPSAGSNVYFICAVRHFRE